MTFREPNLAAKLKKGQSYDDWLPKLDWSEGQICSPKLDGIRIVMHPELGPVTRTLKPIPNIYIRTKMEALMSEAVGFDGELVFGDHESSEYKFSKTSSKFMTEDDSDIADVRFHVFDIAVGEFSSSGFTERVHHYVHRIADFAEFSAARNFFVPVSQRRIRSLEALDAYESECLASFYEGVMLRKPSGFYKQGRSTWKEGGLVALKRFEDTEGIVIGFEPLMRNDNEATVDARGFTVRSSHQAGKWADNLLGKLLCKGAPGTPFEGVEFSVGSGLDDSLRTHIWANKEAFLGKQITFKYQPVGVKNKPRAPIFKGFREE